MGVEVRGRALLRGAPDEGALPGPQAEEAAVHPLPPAVLGVRRHAHAGPPPAPGEVVRRLLARRAPQARRLRGRAGPPAGGERDDGLLPPQEHPRRDGGPAQGRTAREVVSGEVEVDDFYVGAPTRRAVGRGTSRQPMVCAVGTGGGGRCAIGCVPGLSWGDYARFAEGRGDALSHVRADAYGAIAGGLRGWPGLDQRPFSPVGGDALDAAHHVISNFKAYAQGTFHGLRAGSLQGTADEFCWRYNHRGGPVATELAREVAAAAHGGGRQAAGARGEARRQGARGARGGDGARRGPQGDAGGGVRGGVIMRQLGGLCHQNAMSMGSGQNAACPRPVLSLPAPRSGRTLLGD